jgi:GNAT superfamily N-acetyltransferase
VIIRFAGRRLTLVMAKKNHRLTLSRLTDVSSEAAVELLVRQMKEHRIRTPRADVAAAVRGMLRQPRRGFILIARRGSGHIGVAYVSFTWSLEHGGHTAWLEELYVLPEERNGGIGKRMLLAAIARARRAGCAAMDLEVAHGQRRAEHLYRRERFRPLGRSRWVLMLR